MYAQHVRKWSLKTQLQLMPLILLAIYVSTMLLLITCAPTIAAAAATTTHQQQQQQQQQQPPSWQVEENTYYIALPQQQQQQQQQQYFGSSSDSDSNIDNIILSRLLKRPSNSFSSSSNINLRPATVFDAPQQQPQQQQQLQRQQQQSIQKVPNTLINSQIYKLLNNGRASSKTRRHTQQQQQQPQAIAAYSNSTRVKAQRYLIESYELPESAEQTARNRREFNHFDSQRQHRGSNRQQQQQQKREYRQQRQRQRQLQQQQQQHQSQRKHPRKHRNHLHTDRYCSGHDPAQLAFVAPTVFMGVFTSRSADRRANYSATMKVVQVFKQQRDLPQLPQLVRLQFASRNRSSECDIYRARLLPRGLVRGDLEQSSDHNYMMFVQQTNPGNFSILGQPMRVTQSVLQAVRMAVNETYAQNASITKIMSTPSNITMENGKELRIICKVRGRPPPKVTWFKDDKSIKGNRNVYQFKHHKRRSELIVRSFNSSSDAGKYECRAKNKASKTIDKRRIMINAYSVATQPDRSTGYPCKENICFHGGTCMLIAELNSFYCSCPEGFQGERCDNAVLPDSTYSNSPECGDKYYGDILLQSTAKYIHTLNN
ncbi:protein vein isoform X2 [Drosophila busckii]|uniref:protein vein isoform X2 n=1 Tax=Drosophila busckii TaxID=30019 RepID=UPI00083EF710|nr:protein vein isoform X2 [Drosophila busckii]